MAGRRLIAGARCLPSLGTQRARGRRGKEALVPREESDGWGRGGWRGVGSLGVKGRKVSCAEGKGRKAWAGLGKAGLLSL